nr:hypothetical protein [Tanacetum cinerariifolium]
MDFLQKCLADTCVASLRWTVKITLPCDVSCAHLEEIPSYIYPLISHHTHTRSDIPALCFYSLDINVRILPRLYLFIFFSILILEGMSGSEPDEMAPESSKVVVLPEFDMHIYTSELTSSELTTAIEEYGIPMDLRSRLSFPGMTMNRLSSRVTGFLSRIKPEVVLKSVSKSDTNLHDDFPVNCNENDVARLSEFLVPLRPPPRHLLYVCGLTTVFRHPELRYNIKDQDKNVINMDTFLKLPTWTGTTVSRGIPFLRSNGEEGTTKPGKATAKRASAGGAKATPEIGKKSVIVVAPEIARDTLNAEKVIVDMSGNTRVSTPSAEVNQPSPHREHHDTHVSPIHDVHSPPSSYHGNEDELVANRGPQSCLPDFETIYCGPVELECLRLSLRRANQDNEGMTQKLALLDNAHSECPTYQLVVSEEKIKVLEREKLALSAQTQHLDIEGSKPWEAKHRELFTTSYPYIQKVSDSYNFSMSELLAVCPDVPPPLVTERTTSGVAVEDDAQQSPSSALKITSDTPFSTTI